MQWIRSTIILNRHTYLFISCRNEGTVASRTIRIANCFATLSRLENWQNLNVHFRFDVYAILHANMLRTKQVLFAQWTIMLNVQF